MQHMNAVEEIYKLNKIGTQCRVKREASKKLSNAAKNCKCLKDLFSSTAAKKAKRTDELEVGSNGNVTDHSDYSLLTEEPLASESSTNINTSPVSDSLQSSSEIRNRFEDFDFRAFFDQTSHDIDNASLEVPENLMQPEHTPFKLNEKNLNEYENSSSNEIVENNFQYDINTDEDENECDIERCHLSTFGGKSVNDITSKIFKKVIDDQLACNYNYLGTWSQKKAFLQLSLNKVVIDAVKAKQFLEKKINFTSLFMDTL
ncbi:hypothetical protein RN001_012470 [Aquatica leii]|uniref:DUF4806 domain-containing protein n=1 Tax=Aquatica leii TaxID=1421715 RepID=A0AAN7QEW3_9COLE|nr:hypothetical protein RN001_012470 [Aquatica leii]